MGKDIGIFLMFLPILAVWVFFTILSGWAGFLTAFITLVFIGLILLGSWLFVYR